ncbi:MAG: prepilin-type N-terminal cleavage/methylation domain-containing protein [Proteobacteria bacterium]|nr:prepilin-type N-terminal cleavage/methylation domain-containing protein [Pseudomonadota bacterium]RTL33270.1 MAG: prepilin-type N-terminal cleavage/methylation domain-containing protein [Rhodocyclaceae bacterium]
MNKRQYGFTLVEIAVVLVIIGLLLGGILKGQELINGAKVKNVMNDFRTTSTYAFGYQDRFRSLPGDDANVATRLAGAIAASTGGTPGNGRLEGFWNSVTPTDESVLFWQHIRLANFASGDGRNPGSEGVVLQDWLPRNAVGGRIGVTGTSPIAGWNGSFFVCQDRLSGSFGRQIDIALDDGRPDSGSVRLLSDGASSGAAIAADALVDATLYTVCASY